MFSVLRTVLPVFIAVAMIEMASSLLIPHTSYILEQRQISTFLIGAITSCHYIGFVFGAFQSQYLVKQIGHIRAASVYATLAASATLLHILFDYLYIWLLLRFIIGLAIAGLFLVIESWLNAKALPQWRGRILSLYSTISWVFSGIGPIALRFEDSTGNMIFILVALIFVNSMLPFALTRLPNPETTITKNLGSKRIWQLTSVAVMTCFTAGFIYTPLYSLLPSVMERYGFQKEQLSSLLVLGPVMVILTLTPVGWLSDKLGRLPVLAVLCLAATAVAFLGYYTAEPSFSQIMVLFLLLTSLVAPFYSLGMGRAADIIHKNHLVEASSLLLIFWGIGAAIGPAVAGYLMKLFGVETLFLFCGIATLLLGVVILWIVIKKPSILKHSQQHFVAMPLSSTQNVTEVDPRSHSTSNRPK